MKKEPSLTKSWYLLGILIWRTQRTLTLEEQALQIKKELNQKIEKVLDQKADIKKEVLMEINQEIDKALNPSAKRANVG